MSGLDTPALSPDVGCRVEEQDSGRGERKSTKISTAYIRTVHTKIPNTIQK